MKKLAIILAVFVLGIIGFLFLENKPIEDKSNLIVLDSPLPNEIIKSPVTITGRARGFWFFEASFPVRVVDENNQELAVAAAQAMGDWMTEDFVPFKAEVSFPRPTGDRGFIILERDNPSGLPENADQLKIPVRFAP